MVIRCDRPNAEPSGTVMFLVTTYGVSSTRRGDASPVRPVTSPICEAVPGRETR